ncbi:helix-turn-helix domain-containing protein [Ketogulonicigenium robustum]|nr:AraC family transcriptional regulator [Ketogulonicigenium robustum]
MPDDVMAHICLGGEYTINQGAGPDVRGAPGWIYLDPMQRPGTVHYHAPGVHIMYISTPWQKLLELAPATTPLLRQRLPFSPQWAEVLHHARSLHRLADQGMPVDSAAFEIKLRQLFAAACNTSAEQMGLAAQNAGLEARRRLAAIKAKIEEHLIDPLLSAERIATLNGISARYLRSLFAKDKVSFTDYVNARKLARVHAMIVDPERRSVPISKLALECGFNDASWFTSQFRRAFGTAPSDARAQAIVQWQATQPATV